MRIFFDFEFIEGGSAFVMEPISLGMVREDGKEFYREFYFDSTKANAWVKENVIPHLTQDYEIIRYPKGSPESWGAIDIKKEILEFVGEKPEFWAYFSDYDWVLLCQLFGRMVDLPNGWPMWCRDLKQYMWHLGISRDDLPQSLKEEHIHNALEDAKWNLEVFKYIAKLNNRLRFVTTFTN